MKRKITRVKASTEAVQWNGDNVSELLDFANSCGVWGDDFKIDTEAKIVVVLNAESGYDNYGVGTWFIGNPKSNSMTIIPMNNWHFNELFPKIRGKRKE